MQDWTHIDGIGYEIKVINCTKRDCIFQNAQEFNMIHNNAIS